MDSQTINKNIYNIISNDSESESESLDKIDNNTKKVSNIIAFKGCNVVPLNKPNNKEHIGVKSKDMVNKNTKSDNITKFFVGTSYKDSVKITNNNLISSVNPLENKEELVKTLIRTKACKNVNRISEKDEYSICHHRHCSFAHNMEELNDPMCGFDKVCRFRYGKSESDGKNTKCMFRHSDENRDSWIKRTGRTLPDLPLTTYKTNKKVNVPVTVPVPDYDLVVEIPNNIQSNSIPITEQTNTYTSNIDKYNSRFTHTYHRRSRSRSPRRNNRISSRSPNKSNRNKDYVIQVPTKELAELAIKTAFSRGIYNLHIIVD